jgi:hypothetical protein
MIEQLISIINNPWTNFILLGIAVLILIDNSKKGYPKSSK